MKVEISMSHLGKAFLLVPTLVGLGAVAIPGPAFAEKILENCSGATPICDKTYDVRAVATGPAHITFTANSGLSGEGGRHCAPIRLHFLVNGQERGARDFGYRDADGQVKAGALTNSIDLGTVDSGNVIGLRGEILPGGMAGCGGSPLRLSSWGGELSVSVAQAAAPHPAVAWCGTITNQTVKITQDIRVTMEPGNGFVGTINLGGKLRGQGETFSGTRGGDMCDATTKPIKIHFHGQCQAAGIFTGKYDVPSAITPGTTEYGIFNMKACQG